MKDDLSAESHSNPSIILWAVSLTAGISTLCAIYFALQAMREASTAESTARELVAAKDELASAKAKLPTDRSRVVAMASVPPNPAPRPIASETPEAESTPRASSSPDVRSTFRSPAMREMVRQTRLARLRPIYDPLLTQLNLSLEERERFYDLQVTVDDPARALDKLPSEAGSPEERARIEDQIRQTREVAVQQLSSLLGSQGYQLYDGYRATQSERMLVQQFRQQADPRSPQINDWQYDRLRDLLIQARSQYPPVNDDFSASYSAALTQAAQILTPEQLAAFTKYLQNQQEFQNAMRNVLPPGG
jgi:hypothetical protein